MHDRPISARNERILNAIAQVRGVAETAGGAVVVETDVYGTITDLRLTPAAMAVEGSRLAKAISQCHQTAKGRAEAEANRIYAEMMGVSAPSEQAVESAQWEQRGSGGTIYAV